MLKNILRKIKDIRYEKILQKLPGDCQDAYARAISIGISEQILRTLLLQWDKKRITNEQFALKCDNSVYVVDPEMLIDKFKITGDPTGASKTYRYPAAFMGACFGDIAGSAYEGIMGLEQRRINYRNCITPDSAPTDDTILSCATAIALEHLTSYQEHIEKRMPCAADFEINSSYPFKNNPFTDQYKAVIRTSYQNPGFGGAFYRWAVSESRKPYGSAGNGAAMRISPIPEMYANPKDIILLSAMSANATHNHHEAVRGAVIITMMIWMAYNGYDKEQIFQYMKKYYCSAQYSIPVTQKLKKFNMIELRQKPGYPLSSFSVPAAVVCFHESESYEDVMDNVLSFSGDTDTIGAIAGSIAGAYYGVPEDALTVVMRLNTDPVFEKAYKILTKRW